MWLCSCSPQHKVTVTEHCKRKMIIRRIDQNDRKDIDDFIVNHWYTMDMVVRGESIDMGNVDGLYSFEDEKITGLITYRTEGDEMEILSLDSLNENRGTGSRLLEKVVELGRKNGLRRIKLITTNDNLNALRFYQKRGFDICNIYMNALDEARKIKPEIPFIGMNGIPLKHEIELEMIL